VFIWAGLLANLATVFGVPFLIYQIKLARDAFGAEQKDRTDQLERHQTEQSDSLKRRETEEAERAERHRATILSALQIEVETINRATIEDLEDFDLHVRNTPRTQAASNETEFGFKRSFVWTPLPMSTVEQAIHEAYLLNLTKDQLESLQVLRLKLLRVDSHNAAKISVMSALVDNTIEQMREAYTTRWAGVRADNLNAILRTELGQVQSVCAKIIKWLPKNEGMDERQ